MRLAPRRLQFHNKSIAVLPFASLSEDKANAYFADGIQDEILTRLSKIGQLKVISRTSTQQYQSKPGNLAEIAKQLGVAHILEGSVQKAGESVRVNVQLIKAASDSHLWAETYDRKLTDIFAVESEVAQRIAESLEATLTGSEQHALASRPTENPEAYQLYLRGRFFWNKRTGERSATKRSTTLIKLSKRILTMRRPMPRWLSPGSSCQPTVAAHRRNAFRPPKPRLRKRSSWMRVRPRLTRRAQ